MVKGNIMTATNTNTATNTVSADIEAKAKADAKAQKKAEAAAKAKAMRAKVTAAIKAEERRERERERIKADRAKAKARAAAKAKADRAKTLAAAVKANERSNTGKRVPRIVQLRLAAAGGAVGMERATAVSYGAARNYAEYLTTAFGDGWDLIRSDTSNENERGVLLKVKAEKAAFYAACKDRGHSNPTVAWKQVLRAAATVIDPFTGRAVDRPGRGNGPKPPLDKAKADLIRAYKTLFKAQEAKGCPEVVGDIAAEIGRTLTARFRLDLSTLNL